MDLLFSLQILLRVPRVAEKTLGEIAAFLEGCRNQAGSCKAVGRYAETLNILFDPVPKRFAGLRCESHGDRWRYPGVTIAVC